MMKGSRQYTRNGPLDAWEGSSKACVEVFGEGKIALGGG